MPAVRIGSPGRRRMLYVRASLFLPPTDLPDPIGAVVMPTHAPTACLLPSAVVVLRPLSSKLLTRPLAAAAYLLGSGVASVVGLSAPLPAMAAMKEPSQQQVRVYGETVMCRCSLCGVRRRCVVWDRVGMAAMKEPSQQQVRT